MARVLPPAESSGPIHLTGNASTSWNSIRSSLPDGSWTRIEALRDRKRPVRIASYQSHSTLLTMPRLSVTLLCLARPGRRQVWVSSPPSAYSCTSVSDCRPVQSEKPPGGRSSKVTVKRNAGAGSRRAPVLDILCPLFLDLDAAPGHADAHDDELG